MSKLVVHATVLSLLAGSTWKGVLVVGPPGIGKSDMALRAVDQGCVLICDDHACLWSSGGHLYAGPAENAVTGNHPSRKMTRIHLVAVAQSELPIRAPQGEITPVLGHDIPTFRVNPREASCVPRLITRLRQI